jgi:hypothetical protein
MAYEAPVQVNISLATTPIQRASFGTLIFIGAHNYFTDRVRSYGSINEVAEDFPTTSEEYIALNNAFSQDTSPNVVKVGRREVDTLTLTPAAVIASGQTYSVSVTGTDNVTINASFTTSTGSETATDIVTALSAALSGIVGVTVGGTSTLTLAKSGADPFSIADPTRMIVTATTSESAADTLIAIEEVDNEWYFVTAHDHTQTYIEAMAAAVESRTKLYYFATQDTDCLSGVPVATADPLSYVQANSYFRTSGWWYHEADTKFPETAYVAIWSVFDPGKAINALNSIAGLDIARNPNNLTAGLTTSQKTAILDRTGNFTELLGGQNVASAQSGKVAANEWVDVIRNRDFLEARITEDYQSYMVNQKIVPYTQEGINGLESVLDGTLSRYVSTAKSPNVLDSENPFEIRFPKAKDVDFNTKATREFTGEFDAYLAGAIQIVKINGTLSYNGG